MSKEYNEFVEKFIPKKTTDDCYTPPAIYDVVLNYVKEKRDINGLEVLRPFYPGGNYEDYYYPDNCVVVDNPPFSIISKIIRFYNERKIKYFLFAPHLTVFSSDQDFTSIIIGQTLTYENGAKVSTAFVSNLFENEKIIGDAELGKIIKDVENKNKVSLPSYQYPNNVLTVNSISKIVQRGVSITINKQDVKFCKALDSQRLMNKGIFGSGFLISNKAAAEKAAAEKATAKEVIVWELSKEEKSIIKNLG